MVLSCVVSEIINVEKYRYREIRVRDHSRSSEPNPIRVDPPPRTSYERFIVSMGLSRTVFEINGDFSRKLQTFPSPVYSAPPADGVTL